MNDPTSFPPNSDSAYVARIEPDCKTIVSAQYVPNVGFATVLQTTEGKLLEVRYPITSADHIREITREDFENRYQQPIDLMNPKFTVMQQIRDNATGDVLTVIGLPGDNMIVGETLEPAYVCVNAPVTAWEYSDVYPKKIITQKRVERVGAYTRVEEKVGRGMNPAIVHIDEDCSGNGKPIDDLIAELNTKGHYPMGTNIINAAPKSYELGIRDGHSHGVISDAFLQPVVSDDQASY